VPTDGSPLVSDGESFRFTTRPLDITSTKFETPSRCCAACPPGCCGASPAAYPGRPDSVAVIHQFIAEPPHFLRSTVPDEPPSGTAPGVALCASPPAMARVVGGPGPTGCCRAWSQPR
jgi:hypothetical protein